MRIEAAAFQDFPPFREGFITFPCRQAPDDSVAAGAAIPKGEVHLLTGQNGTGKTRLLSLLAAACGNPNELLDRVGPNSTNGGFVLLSAETEIVIWGPIRREGFHDARLAVFQDRGEGIAQWMKLFSLSNIPVGNLAAGSHFANRFEWPAAQQAIALAFRGTVRAGDAKIEAIKHVDFGDASEHLLFDKSNGEDTLICQSMSNLKLGAAMEQLRQGVNSCGRDGALIGKLEQTMSDVTGRKFAFDVWPTPDVHLKVFWGNDTMRIVELPDGLRSIIGWLVSCIAKLNAAFPEHPNPLEIPLILLIDEPESHLHPAWQRKVIPAAQNLFPASQIFVATHSPFVISSVNEGWIHVLQANSNGQVIAAEPRACSRGDSYLDVVEDILGVHEWYDPETEQLLVEFRAAREEVLAESRDLESVRSQAIAIARRSESLNNMMGREIRQLERMLAARVTQK